MCENAEENRRIHTSWTSEREREKKLGIASVCKLQTFSLPACESLKIGKIRFLLFFLQLVQHSSHRFVCFRREFDV